MKNISLAVFLLLAICAGLSAQEKASSPNGKLSLRQKGGGLTLYYEHQPVIDLDFHRAAPMNMTFSRHLAEDYTMRSGKRRHCTNEANEYRLDSGLVVRLYNDGLAFRYEQSPSWQPQQEPTTYVIPEGTRRWMQQWTDSYEGFFPLSTTYKVPPVRSYSGTFKSAEGWNCRWGYPALLEPSDGVFALITEANIERGQSASCLYNEGERFRVVPDKTLDGPLASHSPWRLVIVGRLADVVQSTLVTDVSQPCQVADTSWIQPGVVSWVYWAYNHGSNDFDIIKRYVDLAVSLRLPYVLIDAEWDEMKDGKTIEDAVAYARSKGVKPMIWYNSSVGWVDGAPTPKYRLNKAEDREREFAWCEQLGVAGVKIDFFQWRRPAQHGLLPRPAGECRPPPPAGQLPRSHHSARLAAHVAQPALHRGRLWCRVVQQRAHLHCQGRRSQRHAALHPQRHRPHGLYPLRLQRLAAPPHHHPRP